VAVGVHDGSVRPPRKRDQCEWCYSSARSEFRRGRWWCRGCKAFFERGEG
jgi:ribosomal protein L37AE/L43A